VDGKGNVQFPFTDVMAIWRQYTSELNIPETNCDNNRTERWGELSSTDGSSLLSTESQ
jgi:hypothetical protein